MKQLGILNKDSFNYLSNISEIPTGEWDSLLSGQTGLFSGKSPYFGFQYSVFTMMQRHKLYYKLLPLTEPDTPDRYKLVANLLGDLVRLSGPDKNGDFTILFCDMENTGFDETVHHLIHNDFTKENKEESVSDEVNKLFETINKPKNHEALMIIDSIFEKYDINHIQAQDDFKHYMTVTVPYWMSLCPQGKNYRNELNCKSHETQAAVEHWYQVTRDLCNKAAELHITLAGTTTKPGRADHRDIVRYLTAGTFHKFRKAWRKVMKFKGWDASDRLWRNTQRDVPHMTLMWKKYHDLRNTYALEKRYEQRFNTGTLPADSQV